ncbi:MAG: hypothetical protein ACREB3_10320, partial [Burkholderiales bacterium]
MNVTIQIERSLQVSVPFATALMLMEDLEDTISRFPKLRKLSKLGENAYLWQMEPIGSRIARISHEVSYAAFYHRDPKKGELSWKPLPKHGNASIEGVFKLREKNDGTQISFRVSGELRDVPVPLLYRLVAPPFIQGKFTRLVDIFL